MPNSFSHLVPKWADLAINFGWFHPVVCSWLIWPGAFPLIRSRPLRSDWSAPEGIEYVVNLISNSNGPNESKNRILVHAHCGLAGSFLPLTSVGKHGVTCLFTAAVFLKGFATNVHMASLAPVSSLSESESMPQWTCQTEGIGRPPCQPQEWWASIMHCCCQPLKFIRSRLGIFAV